MQLKEIFTVQNCNPRGNMSFAIIIARLQSIYRSLRKRNWPLSKKHVPFRVSKRDASISIKTRTLRCRRSFNPRGKTRDVCWYRCQRWWTISRHVKIKTINDPLPSFFFPFSATESLTFFKKKKSRKSDKILVFRARRESVICVKL